MSCKQEGVFCYWRYSIPGFSSHKLSRGEDNQSLGAQFSVLNYSNQRRSKGPMDGKVFNYLFS